MPTATYLHSETLANFEGSDAQIDAIGALLESTGYFEVTETVIVDVNTTKLTFRHIPSNRHMQIQLGKKGGTNGSHFMTILAGDNTTVLQTIIGWEYRTSPPVQIYFYIVVSDNGFILDWQAYTTNGGRGSIYGIKDDTGLWYIGNGTTFYPATNDIAHTLVSTYVSGKTAAENYIYTPAVIKNSITGKFAGMLPQVFGISTQSIGYYTLSNGLKAYVISANLMFAV